MLGWRFQWNAGMVVATVLLVAGGSLMVLPGDDQRLLHALGMGIVILAGLVYLAARVAMILKERRR
jgi:hypothetical protein